LKDTKKKYERQKRKEERSIQTWSNDDVLIKNQVVKINQDEERQKNINL
jgi:hypothetical protein